MQWFRNKAHSALSRVAKLAMAFIFIFTVVAPPAIYAQTSLSLPAAAASATLSSAFNPMLMQGLRLDPKNPFKISFIISAGDAGLAGDELKSEGEKLIRYFLASLTLPEDEIWVNLSPYEQDRIVPDALGETEMGHDMLAQDYILKQVTASLINPNSGLGKEFWDKVYQKAYAEYGTTQIPVDTFNKVWIMPEKVVVYTQKDKAFILESKLKVMLEEDYLALRQSQASSPAVSKPQNVLASQVVREVFIPALEQEVNYGKNFSQLRQIYHSLILAYWFKTKLKESIMNKVYADQQKITGIDFSNKAETDKIYREYVGSFKKGIINIVKVEHDPYSKKNLPRKYFAGGIFGKISSVFTTTDNYAEAEKKISSDILGGQTSLLEFDAFLKSLDPAEYELFQQIAAKWKEEKGKSENQKIYNTTLRPILGKTTYEQHVIQNLEKLAETDPGVLEAATNISDLLYSVIGSYSYVFIGSIAFAAYFYTGVPPQDGDVLFPAEYADAVYGALEKRKDIRGLDKVQLKAGTQGVRIMFEVKTKDAAGNEKWIPYEMFGQAHAKKNADGTYSIPAAEERNGVANILIDKYTFDLAPMRNPVSKDMSIIPVGDQFLAMHVYASIFSNEASLFSPQGRAVQATLKPKAMLRLFRLLSFGMTPESIIKYLAKIEFRIKSADGLDLAAYGMNIFKETYEKYQGSSGKGFLSEYYKYSKNVDKGMIAKAVDDFSAVAEKDERYLNGVFNQIKRGQIILPKEIEKIKDLQKKYLEYKSFINGEQTYDLVFSLAIFNILDRFIDPLLKAISAQEEIREKGSAEQLDLFDLSPQEKSEPVEVVASPVQVTPGGIDFNARNMNIETRGEEAEFTLPENFQDVKPDDVIGLTPVILNILSVPDVLKFLKTSTLPPDEKTSVEVSKGKDSGNNTLRPRRLPSANYACRYSHRSLI